MAEAARLLAACPDEILAAVAIGLFAGLRAAEIARLDWQESISSAAYRGEGREGEDRTAEACDDFENLAAGLHLCGNCRTCAPAEHHLSAEGSPPR